MKQKKSAFTIKPFKNRNSVISFRVAGWLLGERIRKNFKTREDAIAERAALELRQLQSQSNLRGASTFLTEAQLREAEAAFLRLEKARRPLTFYLDYALANYREPEAALKIADAVTTYMKARKEDVQQALIGKRQLRNIRLELTEFQRHFPTQTLAEAGTEALHAYIRRDDGALKTQNNRRGVLCAFFNHAVRKEWVGGNPVAKIPRNRIEHNRGSAEALTAERAAQLMAHVETVHDGAFVPFFALCLFAGIRPEGEISKLPAADVRLENSAITIEPWVSKVNMRRLITIQPNLAAWLKAYPLDEYPVIPPKDKMKTSPKAHAHPPAVWHRARRAEAHVYFDACWKIPLDGRHGVAGGQLGKHHPPPLPERDHPAGGRGILCHHADASRRAAGGASAAGSECARARVRPAKPARRINPQPGGE
ncbi:site-specific integrase [Termitidicoccus mucosus]|uniref:site-specific integrase n=1 Tax=Termitidicoccus mucosus TaxID=1184151 RepID=UPI003183D859